MTQQFLSKTIRHERLQPAEVTRHYKVLYSVSRIKENLLRCEIARDHTIESQTFTGKSGPGEGRGAAERDHIGPIRGLYRRGAMKPLGLDTLMKISCIGHYAAHGNSATVTFSLTGKRRMNQERGTTIRA